MIEIELVTNNERGVLMEKYYDKNGREIKKDMKLRHDNGDVEQVYETDDGNLGFNASNEKFIGFNELNRQLYPLDEFDLSEWEII